jgi:hypothetical protein
LKYHPKKRCDGRQGSIIGLKDKLNNDELGTGKKEEEEEQEKVEEKKELDQNQFIKNFIIEINGDHDIIENTEEEIKKHKKIEEDFKQLQQIHKSQKKLNIKNKIQKLKEIESEVLNKNISDCVAETAKSIILSFD